MLRATRRTTPPAAGEGRRRRSRRPACPPASRTCPPVRLRGCPPPEPDGTVRWFPSSVLRREAYASSDDVSGKLIKGLPRGKRAAAQAQEGLLDTYPELHRHHPGCLVHLEP